VQQELTSATQAAQEATVQRIREEQRATAANAKLKQTRQMLGTWIVSFQDFRLFIIIMYCSL